MFRRSSAVEQLTVNQLVVGSIPTAGAKSPCKVLIWKETLGFLKYSVTQHCHTRNPIREFVVP